MVWLPDGEKISKISLFVLAQLMNVTDRQTDGQTDGRTLHADIGRAYASHRAAKTAKIKTFINYKREIYALAHLNMSTDSFKCLS